MQTFGCSAKLSKQPRLQTLRVCKQSERSSEHKSVAFVSAGYGLTNHLLANKSFAFVSEAVHTKVSLL